jgi:hypothetical protein
VTFQELINTVESKVRNVVSGGGSSYVSWSHPDTNEIWTIRVSNHNANPQRVDINTVSFVVLVPDNESDEAANSMTVNKKKFSSIANQFFLDENGEFDENFLNMKECLEYVLF